MQGSFAFFYVGEISGSQINLKLQFPDFHATTLAQNSINKETNLSKYTILNIFSFLQDLLELKFCMETVIKQLNTNNQLFKLCEISTTFSRIF